MCIGPRTVAVPPEVLHAVSPVPPLRSALPGPAPGQRV